MAKTFSCVYENMNQFTNFLEIHALSNQPNLLVQVISEKNNDVAVLPILEVLKRMVPKAVLVQGGADGEFCGGGKPEDEIVLVFTIFEPAELKEILLNMRASRDLIHEMEERTQNSEHHYESLFRHNFDFVYTTDLGGRITGVNPAFLKAFGGDEKKFIGKQALKFVREEDIPRLRRHFIRVLNGLEQSFRVEIPAKNGENHLFEVKSFPVLVNGKQIGTCGIGRNITDRKKIEERMAQLAYYDQDTGLPNRMKFTEQLETLLYQAHKEELPLSVLFIDMDRFKLINDSLGHEAGDFVLKELAGRIQAVIPKESFLGRFGGDKYSLILTKNVNMEETVKTAKLILQAIGLPVVYKGQEYFVSASVGISFFPEDGTDQQALLKHADIAMNRSKNQGGNRITFYSTEMNEEALARIELESYLRKALEKNEFFLCYQPLIDLKTGKTFGSEALIRWMHPKFGLVPPGEFIPLAEETGLIEEIGAWVLRTACKQTKEWQEKELGDLSISVNVSAYQFQGPSFLDEVKKALSESKLDPKFLTLELTESAMLRNIDNSIAVMEHLRELGVKVSVDDFGTGYSSLSYLRNLPINLLKIDRSFINNLHANPSDIAIVKAIITMGKGLSVKVVAEGVETKEQIELLRKLRCHYAQGYYLFKPLSAQDFEWGIRDAANGRR